MGTLRGNLKLLCLVAAVIVAGCSRPAPPQTPIHVTFSRDGKRFLIDVTQPSFVHDDGLVRVFDSLGTELSASPLDDNGRATCKLAPGTFSAVVEVQLRGRPSDLIYLIFDAASGRSFPDRTLLTFNRECCLPEATGSAASAVPPAVDSATPSTSSVVAWGVPIACIVGVGLAIELAFLLIQRLSSPVAHGRRKHSSIPRGFKQT